MKNINIALLLTFGILIASCSEDIPDREASPLAGTDTVQVYFPTGNSVLEIMPGAETFNVKISRLDATKAETVSISKIDRSNVFTVPSEVVFAPAEKDATITVTVKEMELFVNYNLELIIDIASTNPYVPNNKGAINTYLTVIASDWEIVFTGKYVSELFGTMNNRTLQYSKLLDTYRFLNLYASNVHYTFKREGEKGIIPGGTLGSNGLYSFVTGSIHATYGMITSYTDPDIKYTYYDEVGKKVVFYREFKIPSGGSFGWIKEVFELQ